MITVEAANHLINENVTSHRKEIRALGLCTGYISASSINSPIDSPPFAQSAMDGYAFKHAELANGNRFKLQGVIQAGETTSFNLQLQKCFRIFTGAPIPEGADTVIMQEHCLVENNIITFNNHDIVVGANVRPLGSQVGLNEEVLKCGIRLTPGIIGYLTSLGIKEIEVYSKPRVNMLITGSELVRIGTALKFGQIYESNSTMLEAALSEGGIKANRIYFSKDTLFETSEAIANALLETDILLITGGISVGDYDYVQEALKINDVKTVFYKLKQKPGKPLFFGIKENTYIFALPGNPSSVLTCFYEYVIPTIRKFSGGSFEKSGSYKQPLLHDYEKKGNLTHYLKAHTTQDGVVILGAQESYKLNSFTEANCLVMIEEEKNQLKKGDLVEVHLLSKLWL